MSIRHRHSRFLLSTLAVLALLSGCAAAPVQELSDARQAIAAARMAGGEQYTPETLSNAETLVADASVRLHRGEYREARDAALWAKRKAYYSRKASLAVYQVK